MLILNEITMTCVKMMHAEEEKKKKIKISDQLTIFMIDDKCNLL